MAETTNTQGSGVNQVIGKVFILYGKVKAIALDGTVRVLEVNSPVFAMERIVTESDGSVSIFIDGTPPVQIDIGRMSDIMMDEDIYAGVGAEEIAAATAEVDEIQAMLEGEGDIELDATAAGGTADSGGGHETVVFELTGEEVAPESGAETTGVGGDTVDPYPAEGTEEEGGAPAAVVGNLTLTALPASGGEGVYEGGQITYVVTVDNTPQDTPLVVTLDNGAVITIAAGETTGSVTVDAPSDDPYIDAGPVSAAIESAEGGGYDEIVIDETPVETMIEDTIDPTTVSLSASESVDEGGQIIYTATVENAPQSDITITLSNGATIVIAAGATSGSVTVDAPGDDVYVDAGEVSVTIVDADTDNFEQLVIDDAPAVSQIPDTIDPTTVSLSASGSVDEGGQITYTATVTNPPQSDMTVTLSNGATIIIEAGGTSGSVTVDAPGDDVYVDAGEVSVTIVDADTDNFEQLVIDDAPAVSQVADTIDTTTVSLSAGDVDENAEGVTFTATLSNPGETDVTIATSLGDIVIAAGQTEGTLFVSTADPDVYVDPDTITATVTGVTGGNFEDVDYSQASATAQISDTIDTTTVSLSAGDVDENAEGVTFTATLSNPGETDVTIATSLGDIVIAAGQTEGTLFVDTSDPDVYVDPDTITATVTGVTGGNFEDVDYSQASATAQISDTIDTTTVSLSAGDVDENAEGVTFTATLSNPGETDVTIATSLGDIVIAAGQTEGTLFVDTSDPDVYVDPDTITATVTGVTGGNFEDVDYSQASATAQISDTIDTTTVSLSAGDVDENAEGVTFTATLSNPGETDVTIATSLGDIVIAAGQTEGTLFVSTADPDVYVDPDTITATVTGVTGGNFEDVDYSQASATAQISDTIDTTTVSLSAGDVDENAEGVTFTATLSNPGETDVTIATSLGDIVIAAGQTEGTLFVDTSDPDVYVDPDTITATVTGVTGGNFEDVDYSQASATAQISDTIDTTTVSLSVGDVDENAEGVTFTATLSNPGETDVTIATSLGDIVIAAGQTEGTLFVDTSDPDVYVDPDTITATVTGVTGGNFEDVDYSQASATAQISDTIDTTTVSLSAGDVDENAEGVTFTATLSNPGETDVTIATSLGDIVIAAGQTEGTLFVDTSDPDVYVDPDTITATVTGVTGGNFEDVDYSQASATAQISDTIDTTTVSLSAGDVDENAEGVTFTATLSNPGETDVTIATSLGDIVIAAGQTEGTLFVDTSDPDVYVDPDTITATVTGVTGGNFEAVDYSQASATAQISDTIDMTMVSLSAGDVDENAEGVTFTATLSNPGETDVTIATSLGDIVIAAGQTEGTLFVSTADPDVYVDPDTITATVTGVTGGNFEAVDYSAASATAEISDTIDTTTVSLSAGDVDENAEGVTFTATLSNPGETDVTIATSLGDIVIAAGQTEGTLFVDTSDPDVYVDPDTITATVTGVTGGNFEDVDYSQASATAEISDTIDTTTVSLSGTESVSEGTSATYIVSVDHAPQTDMTVDVLYSYLSASTNDIVTNTTQVVIPADQTSVQFTVDALNDMVFEGTETFEVSISNPQGGNFENLVLGNTTVETAITDSEQPGVLSIDDVSVTEPDSGETVTATFTVTLSQAADQDVTVEFTTADGTAIAGGTGVAESDYGSTSGTLTILAGQTSATIDVTVNGDDYYEGAEQYYVNLTDAQGPATIADNQGLGTIVDNEQPGVLSIDDVSVTEPDSGETVTATFTVTLSQAADQDVTVHFATADGTAIAGGTGVAESDYGSTSGTLTIPAGQTSATIDVTVNGDDYYEGAEQYYVNLTDAQGPATIADNQGLGTIVDNEQPGVLSIDDVSVTEPDSGETVTATFTVTLSQAADQDVTVHFATADGTAIAGGTGVAESDYGSTSGTLTIPAGQTSATIDVTVNGDDYYEGAEQYYVNLTDAQGPATIADNQGLGTIVDNEQPGVLSIDDVSVTEPDSGETVTATFTVTLSQAADQDVTVHFATADGTAIAGGTGVAESDYGQTSGTLTILAGQTSATIDVTVNGDDYYEGAEQYYVNLTDAQGPATIADNQGLGTIVDNEQPGVLSIDDVSVTEPDSGETVTATFTVTLSQATDQDVTVAFTTADGTAISGGTGVAESDYGSTSGTLTILAGQTSATIDVTVNGDDYYEGAEQYYVNLTDAQGPATIADNQGLGTIVDNEQQGVLSINDVTVTEPDSGETVTATFTVTLSQAADQDVTVHFATADGTAIAGGTGVAESDYGQTSGTLTILAGQTSATIDVTVNGDDYYEGAEQYYVNLTDAQGPATIADNQGLGTIVDNEQPGVLSIDDVSVTEPDSGETVTATFTVTLSQAADQDVTVHFATADGTAIAGGTGVAESDYGSTSGTLTILAGQTSATIDVTVNGDDYYEGAEQYYVNLTDAQGPATIADNQGLGTIVDNEQPGVLSIDDVSVTEPDSGETVTATFTVTLSQATDQDVTVAFTTADGTAISGGTGVAESDYGSTSGTLTILAGQTSATIDVTVNGDDYYEGAEQYYVNLDNAQGPATIADAQGIGTIEDNEQQGVLSINDVTVTEPDSGETVTATFTVTLSQAADQDVTVHFATADGTAIAGGTGVAESDYGATEGTLTIPAGQTSATIDVTVNGDDYYEGTEQYYVNLSDASGPASIIDSQGIGDILDDEGPPTILLNDVTVYEGSGTAVISATISALPADGDLVLTLSNGATVTFTPGGSTTVDSTPFTVQGDDPYVDGEFYEVSISSHSGGAENMDLSDTATVTIDDTIDTTTVSLDDVTVDEGTGTAVISATISALPTEGDLVLTLSNGATVTFTPGGSLTVDSTPFAVQGDDPYVDGESYDVSVSSHTGGAEFEDLDLSDTATVTIDDTIDTTTVSLGDVTVDEGTGTAVISATISALPTEGDLVLTLSNGATVTFTPGGSLTVDSTPFAVQGDDPYVDGESYDVSVSSHTGGAEFEDLDLSDTATVTIDDTIDTTTVSLGDVTVDEGTGTAVISATISALPTEGDLVLTLSNGATVTFTPGGSLTVDSTPFAVQGDDPYVDGESYDVSVSSHTGGAEFEDLDLSDTATVTIDDTIDTTTVSLGDVTVDEGTGTAVISATISALPTEGDLVLTLSNGATVTFTPGGSLTVDSTPFAVQGDDPYVDGESYDVSVSSHTGGAEFEDLDLSDTATVTIDDTIDTTTVSLDDVTVDEGTGTAVISATISALPTEGDLVLTLSNGATVTFTPGGSLTVDSTPFAVQGDDPYVDGESYDVSVSSHTGGAEFEDLDLSDTATVTIDDTIDTTTVSLGDVTVDEGTGTAVISATISALPTEGDLVLTLSNGATVTFTPGGSLTVDSTPFAVQGDDPYVDGESYDVSVSSHTGGAEFEDLDLSDTATVTIDDTIDTTTVSLGDVTVDEGTGTAVISATISALPTEGDLVLTLSNGATVTFTPGGSLTVDSTPFAVQGDDPYVDGESYDVSVSSHTGGAEFEDLDLSDTATVTIDDTIDTTTVSLGDVTVDEGTGTAVISATISALPTEGDLVLTLSNGATVTFTPGGSLTVDSTPFAVQGDDPYVDGESYDVSVSSHTGGAEFEDLDLSDTATVTIDDTIDTTTVSLGDVTVDEGTGTAVISATISALPTEGDLVLTLSNGATVTFTPGGSLTVDSTPFAVQGDDPYVDGESYDVSVSSHTGGAEFEDLDLSDTATVTIDDTIDTTTVSLGDVTVDEGTGTAVISATISALPTEGDLVLTLSNGATVTFTPGGSLTVDSTPFAVQGDDPYVDGESYDVSVSSHTGGAEFEDLDLSDTATVTIDDTIDTTTVSLGDVTVDEGTGTAVISATISALPTEGDLVLTLSNGATVTFTPGGSLTVDSTPFAVQGDDPYVDGESYDVSVSSHTGGAEFEDLDLSDTATVTIDDTIDTTTVSLGDVTVDEGTGTAVISATISALPTEGDLVLTLSNGATVTFTPGGSLTVDSTPFAVQGDDPYVDGESYDVSVSSHTGGAEFEDLDLSDTATVTIDDTIDTTTVSLGDVTVDEGTGTAVISATISALPTEGDLVLTLSNGATVTFTPGGSLTVDSTPFAVQGDDPYVDGESYDVSVSSHTGGAEFEDLDLSDTATVTIDDTIDTTTVSLGDVTVDEGTGTAVISATISALPTEGDLVLTLSNGATVTFTPGGSLTVDSTPFAVQGDDPYVDGESYDVSVSSHTGGAEFEDLDLSDTATVTIDDTIDTTTVSLGDVTVDEGTGTAVISATISALPTEGDLVLTLSNGATVTFTPGGSLTVDSTPFAVQGDDPYVDGESYDVSVSSHTGGAEFEDLDLSDTATVTIDDTIDTTTVSLGDVTVDEGTGTAVISATISALPTEGDLVLTLSNGATVTFTPGGSLTVDSTPFAVQGDDPYVDGESYDVSVSSHTGGAEFEDLDLSDTATVTIDDTIDTTTVSLGDVTVDEGTGTAVISATISALPTEGDLVLTLSNGATVTFTPGGSLTVDSTPFAVQGDDPYVDGESYDVSVSSHTGGAEFEDLDLSDTATVTIDDTIDTTTVSLGDVTVDEGTGTAVISATISALPTEGDLVLTLSNGATVTFTPGGSLTVDSTPFAVQGDDPYVDGESYDVSVSSHTGGAEFEDLDLSDTATVTIDDTIDTTTVSLGDVTVDEGTGTAVISATISALPTEGDLVLTLSNGATVTFTPGGSLTVDSTPFAVQGDDPYVDGESYDVSVSSHTGGAEFEDLDLSDTATVTIDDTIDTTTVSLGDVTVDEGTGTAVISATISALPTEGDLVLTLSNGATVTFTPGGSLTVDSTPFAVQGDDPYVDGESYDVSVSSHTGGAEFEDLDLSDTATVTIDDTIDTTTVSLGDVTVDEGTGTAVISATISALPTEGDLVLTLSNGATVTFTPGGSLTVDSTPFAVQGDDPYVDGESYDVSVSSHTGGAEFEDLDLSDTATVTIDDTIDTTTVSLGDVTVDEGTGTAVISATISALPTEGDLVLTLSNGATVTFTPGGSLTVDSTPFAVQGDDPYVDGESYDVSVSSHTGGAEFEDLDLSDTATVTIDDTIDTTTVSLGDVTVDEGTGTAVISATISALPTEGDLVLTLSNGATVTFTPGGSLTVDSTPFAVQGDDPYVDGESYDVSVSSHTGGAEFEDLDLSDTATVTIDDTIDTTTVSLGDVTVDEGTGTAVISATISALPTEGDLVLTLSNGATVTFTPGGSLTVDSTPFAVQGDDPYVDGESYDVSVSSHTGGAEFEDLDLSDTATVTIDDTIDTTTVSLSGPESVSEGASATYIVSVDHAPQTDMTMDVSYSYLSASTNDIVTNTTQVTIQANQTSVQFAVEAVDDTIFEGNEDFEVSISNPQGGNFENLVLGNTTVQTEIVDDDTLPIAAPDNDVTVYESALDLYQDGNDLAAGTVTGTNPNSTGETDNTNTLVGSVSGGAGGYTYTLVGGTDGTGFTTIDGEYGVINLYSDGSYTYTLTDPVTTTPSANDGANTEVGEIFTYQVTDSAGQTATSTIKVNIVDDVPTAGITTAATLDDEGLNGGNPDGPDDVPGELTTTSGELPHNFGADGAGSIDFYAMDGQQGPIGVETITYSWSGDTLTATVTGGDRAGTELFTVQVAPTTGAYTVTLLDNVLHSPPDVSDTVQTIVNTSNTNLETGITDDGMVKITVDVPGDESAELNFNDNEGGGGTAFGIDSSVDGDYSYSAEINYLGIDNNSSDTNSETMIFTLQNGAGEAAEGKVAITATVDINVFYAAEDSVGNEVGAYELYKDGALVQAATTFEATSADGNFQLVINGPEGGFDEIRFSSRTGSEDTSGDDSSDYNIKQIIFDLVTSENDETVNLDYTVTDADGDQATGTLTLTIDDDTPIAFIPQSAILTNGFTGTIGFAANAGADGVGDVEFTVADGTPVTDNDGNQITMDGETLFYEYEGGDQSVLYARTQGGDTGFTIQLDSDGDNYIVTVNGELLNGTLFNAVALNGVSGGNSNVYGLNINADDVVEDNDVIVSTEAGDTVNTSVGKGIGISQAQTITDGEIVRFDFVSELTVDGSGGSWTDSQDISSFRQEVVIGGNENSTSSLSIYALTDVTATSIPSGSSIIGNGDYITLQIDDLRVYDSNGVDVTASVTISQQDTGLLVSGLKDGYEIELTTEQTFQAIEIHGEEGYNFNLGDFTFYQGGTATGFEFDLSIVGEDGDGDLVASTLTVTTPIPDELYVGDNNDQDFDSTGGNDVIIGDAGGKYAVVEAGQNYNISLIVDTSMSMGDRMVLVKAALTNLVTQLSEHDGVVNLQIIDFNTSVTNQSVFLDIDPGDLNGESSITAAINEMTSDGVTNYEAGFVSATTWFNSQTNGYTNLTFFLTDGDPTYYLDDNGLPAGEWTGTTYYEAMHNSVEAFAILSSISKVEAIGIGNDINESYLKFFDNTDVTGEGIAQFHEHHQWLSVEGPVGEVVIVNTAGELEAALQGGSSSEELAPLGDDDLNGGDGNDIIFGDSINTDHLAWTDLDSGEVFTANEHDGLGYSGLIEYLKWAVNGGTDPDDQQIMDYIRSHLSDLIDDGRTDGGDDTLHGGYGDDTLIGEAGNDILDGGPGHDHLYGGPGDDILDGGPGDDTIDGGEGSDLLDFSDATGGIDITLTQSASSTSTGEIPGLGTDTYSNMEGVIGSDYDDTITGSDHDDRLFGGEGNDELFGGSGDDTLDGGAGDDTMTGGLGADVFKAGEGQDTITDFSQPDGDVLDISHVIETGNTLDVVEGLDGKAQLNIMDGTDVKGSVLFDNVNYADLDHTDLSHELDSLLGPNGLDDDPNT